MMKKRINNTLINSYCDRINVSGILLDRKALRNKLNELNTNSINDMMTTILNSSNSKIIASLKELGVNARNNKKTSRIQTIIGEMQKHFPNSQVIYNQSDNTFEIIGTENMTLRLVKNNDKYSVQKVVSEENTNNSNTNNKAKQYTLSSGKPSAKLFVNDEVA